MRVRASTHLVQTPTPGADPTHDVIVLVVDDDDDVSVGALPEANAVGRTDDTEAILLQRH